MNNQAIVKVMKTPKQQPKVLVKVIRKPKQSSEQSSNSKSDEKTKTATSLGIGVGLITISVVDPPLGAAMSTACLGTGIGMKVVGSLTDNDEMEETGEIIKFGAEIGAVGNQAVNACKK